MRARENRFRHLLTIWRGVSKRDAITSLDNPSSARRMILARITSQYGDVYFRVMDSSVCRSSLERFMSNGLFLGISDNSPWCQRIKLRHQIESNNTSSYLRIGVLSENGSPIRQ